MRKFLFSVFILILIFGCKDQKVIERYDNGSVKLICEYYKGKRNGKCIGYYLDGSIEFISYYTNDTLNGKSTFYHKNGELNWEVNFVHGTKNGVIEYFDSTGTKFQLSTFKNDKLNGISKSFYSNGDVKDEMNYKNGELDGVFKTYFKNGSVKKEITYSDNTEIDYIEFDSIGNVKNEMIQYDIVSVDDDKLLFKINNPIFPIMGIRMFIKNESEDTLLVQQEFFSEKNEVMIDMNNVHKDTLRGFILELDAINDTNGIVKRSRKFEYVVP